MDMCFTPISPPKPVRRSCFSLHTDYFSSAQWNLGPILGTPSPLHSPGINYVSANCPNRKTHPSVSLLSQTLPDRVIFVTGPCVLGPPVNYQHNALQPSRYRISLHERRWACDFFRSCEVLLRTGRRVTECQPRKSNARLQGRIYRGRRLFLSPDQLRYHLFCFVLFCFDWSTEHQAQQVCVRWLFKVFFLMWTCILVGI